MVLLRSWAIGTRSLPMSPRRLAGAATAGLVLALLGLDCCRACDRPGAVGRVGLALGNDYDVVQFAGDVWIGFEGMVEILCCRC